MINNILLLIYLASQTAIATSDSQQINSKNIEEIDQLLLEEQQAKYFTVEVLNKTTAKSNLISHQVKDYLKFGSLELIVHQCWVANADQNQGDKVLIEINEQKLAEQKLSIFYGWMFASSPALMALEHPVYDIKLINCQRNR